MRFAEAGAFLGPCRCQGCGTLVWWARIASHGSVVWREQTGRVHRCINGKRDGRSSSRPGHPPVVVA